MAARRPTGPILYQIHDIWKAIKSSQFKNALELAMGLPRMVVQWWKCIPLITYTINVVYCLCILTVPDYSRVPWIQVSLSLLYHGYLCSKMESYIGSLRFLWAFIIWASISLMFSMIYTGTVGINPFGVWFSIQAVDAVIRRERNRVELGFIRIRTELFPFVVMLLCHFTEVGSLPFHICGVIVGYAYAYGFFDMLQPGYLFWSNLEDRMSNWLIDRRCFFRCTRYEHTSDLLAHILISDILQFYGHNIFRRAPIDVEIENLEQKIERMVHDGFHPDDAAYIL